MVGVAVKVTEPPAQIVVVVAAMVTDGVTVVAVIGISIAGCSSRVSTWIIGGHDHSDDITISKRSCM